MLVALLSFLFLTTTFFKPILFDIPQEFFVIVWPFNRRAFSSFHLAVLIPGCWTKSLPHQDCSQDY